MIFERSSVSSTVQPPPMLRCPSPAARPASPAVSEISVGSPSPPLQRTAFQPLNMKRIRLHNFTASQEPQPQPQPQSVAARRKSCAERTVKSFSIADILGKRDEPSKEADEEEPRREKIPAVPMRDSHVDPVPGHPAGPRLLLDPSVPGKVLGPWEAGPAPRHPLAVQPPLLQPAGPPALPLRPFFPPAALFHYEQRLAWDYQRQLQEHFHVQAQLLRQMSLDPTIIPSEDGSERCSRSSSTASECCTPEEEADAARRPSGEADHDSSQRRQRERSQSKADPEESGRQQKSAAAAVGDTPLDALFQLSTKNFDEEQDPATLNIFATRPTPKKKRKSRTAFTNHQIFELEKRFLYQKYLSPADRDEIASGLGLSNAQVITWFQNRRAKLKRDMEELKKDVESVKQLSAHKSFLENVNDFSILKTRPVSRHQQQQPTQLQAATATIPQPRPDNGRLSPESVAIDIEGNDGGDDGGINNNTANDTRPPAFEQAARYQSNHSRG